MIATAAAATPLDTAMSPPLDPIAHVVAVARAHAEAVDHQGTFPAAAVAAMRDAGLLGMLVPRALGGPERSMTEAARCCYEISKACASSAMVLAMHHIQVACLVRHASGSAWHDSFLRQVAEDGLLLASVTSELGVGGSMRTSLCALQPGDEAGSFVLAKRSTAISYGAYADALLITSRSHPDADTTDQVLVVVPVAQAALRRTGQWDVMGMRGTCSEAFDVNTSGLMDQVIPDSFANIAARTMVPVAHLLWSSLWAGIAADAVARARAFLRRASRQNSGEHLPGATQLVTAIERLQMVEARVNEALRQFDAADQSETFAAAAGMNMLKTGASEICLETVQQALLVCGFSGYSNTGPFSVSRHLRDLNSARLMISNDRIRDNTARLLLMQAPTLGIG